MSWVGAIARGLLIVAYFVLATVWLPDKVASIDAVESAARVVRDLVIAGVWAVALGAGLWLVRAAQRRGIV